MGSIVRHGDGWRAHVYVKGQRESQLFRTQREAKAWADRREEELRAGPAAVTFEKVFEDWLALHLPTLDNAANQRTVEQSLRDYVLPTLGGKALAEITRPDLVTVVKAISDTGKVETAQRVGQRICKIFDLAADSGIIGHNHPAANLARVLPRNKRKRHMPTVKPADVPALLHDVDSYSEPTTRAGLWLLAYTFTRTAELIGASWDEIADPVTWVVPRERMKRRLPQVVPLSRQVLSILEDLKATGDGSRYFLPSEVNPMCGLSNNTLLFALYRLGYKGRMTGHGFRSVASTILNESKLWHPDAIERQLSHGETDRVRDAYNMAEYLEERRRMMQWWSDHLDGLLASHRESLAASTAS